MEETGISNEDRLTRKTSIKKTTAALERACQETKPFFEKHNLCDPSHHKAQIISRQIYYVTKMVPIILCFTTKQKENDVFHSDLWAILITYLISFKLKIQKL